MGRRVRGARPASPRHNLNVFRHVRGAKITAEKSTQLYFCLSGFLNAFLHLFSFAYMPFCFFNPPFISIGLNASEGNGGGRMIKASEASGVLRLSANDTHFTFL